MIPKCDKCYDPLWEEDEYDSLDDYLAEKGGDISDDVVFCESCYDSYKSEFWLTCYNCEEEVDEEAKYLYLSNKGIYAIIKKPYFISNFITTEIIEENLKFIKKINIPKLDDNEGYYTICNNCFENIIFNKKQNKEN